MNVSGLSRDNVASHLQKHRLGLKRGKSRKRRPSTLQVPKSKQAKGSDAQMGGPCDENGAKQQMDLNCWSAVACIHDSDQSVCADLIEQEGTPVRAVAAADTQYGDAAKSCEASKPASEMPQGVPSREGDGIDCEGSNERDDCDANEGPASDDGAGAGSDNRTACNVSGMDPGEMAPHASHAGEGCSPEAADGQHAAGDGGLRTCPVDGDGALGSSGDGSQERKHTEASPFHSRSGSNLASKQQITSNGGSGVNGSGSEPTEGSRNGGAGQSTNKGNVQLATDTQIAAEAAIGDVTATVVAHASAPAVSAGRSLVTQSSGARKGGGLLSGEMLPVGMPMQLPCDIQVPVGNTERICAPRTGDGSWQA